MKKKNIADILNIEKEVIQKVKFVFFSAKNAYKIIATTLFIKNTLLTFAKNTKVNLLCFSNFLINN